METMAKQTSHLHF